MTDQPTSDGSADLGAVVSTHAVDNERRRTIAVGGLVLAVFVGIATMAVLSEPEHPTSYQPNQGQLSGALIALTASSFVIGAVNWWKAWRGGTGEYFELREHGFAHTNSRRTRIFPWETVAHVRVRKAQAANPIARYFGTQYVASVAIRGRRRAVRVHGLVHRHTELAEAIMANCGPAPPLVTTRQRQLWLALALGGVGLVAFLIYYLRAHQDTERTIDHGSYTEVVAVPGVSGVGSVLVVVGLVAGGVLAIVGVTMALRRD
ncbi:hypothetical protein F0L68_16455 [Solihabitans fulvus]|uniref:PH domain-containing protein n=1 Tax=Solihabitans fulvus TaxID=1892852 RepID=A0A5B2XCM8_9PSEU|nr:hypothetical protein [Solihabitans fulvus]KAA2261387.1 hypothetical protein F0L68_16455 [Solihabitans fulvus]